MVNMDFTEFWYCGKPEERAEYQRKKKLLSDNTRVEAVLSEMKQHKPMKQNKKRRKRRKRFPRTLRYRLKG